jgi:chromosome segregation ATPase
VVAERDGLKNQVASSQNNLAVRESDLATVKADLDKSKAELVTVKADLDKSVAELAAVKADLDKMEEQIVRVSSISSSQSRKWNCPQSFTRIQRCGILTI